MVKVVERTATKVIEQLAASVHKKNALGYWVVPLTHHT